MGGELSDHIKRIVNSELNDRILQNYKEVMESRRGPAALSSASSKEVAARMPREERELIAKAIVSSVFRAPTRA